MPQIFDMCRAQFIYGIKSQISLLHRTELVLPEKKQGRRVGVEVKPIVGVLHSLHNI